MYLGYDMILRRYVFFLISVCSLCGRVVGGGFNANDSPPLFDAKLARTPAEVMIMLLRSLQALEIGEVIIIIEGVFCK